eukprot:87397_1
MLPAVLLLCITITTAENVCNLTGPWTGYFPASQKYNDNEEYYIPSSTHNAQTNTVQFEVLRTWGTGWTEGHGIVNLETLRVTMYLDGDTDSPGVITLNGKTDNASCHGIDFDNGSRWVKQMPFIKYVHVIHMSHLDVGYDGISPTVGYINNVMNKYFQSHLPRSLYLSKTMKQTGHQRRGFVYTQQPWLMSFYLNCPRNFTLNNVVLQCPTETELAEMKQAIANGDLTWQASAFNVQFEAMDETIFQSSLNVAKQLNQQFGIKRRQFVVSSRDVPGITRAVIPLLAKNNITAVSIGQNGQLGPPPAPFDTIDANIPYPRIFRWRDVESETEVIALWHSYGYGGIKRSDCIEVPYSSHAFCAMVKGDNSGPPETLNYLLNEYTQIESEFPGAIAFSSTFEDFVSAIYAGRAALPVVTTEFGDVWLQGIGSDPLKMAVYREASRAHAECIQSGACSYDDPVIQDFERFLMKLPEHTWGLPSELDPVHWSNDQFHALRKTQSSFVNCSNAWVEQRQFADYAIKALGDHALAKDIMNRLRDLVVQSAPDLSAYIAVSGLGNKIRNCNGIDVQFDGNYGSIVSFVGTDGREWASVESPLGIFEYVSYDETDYNYMCTVYGTGCYKKRGSQNYTIRNKWQTKMDKLYILNTTGSCSVVTHLVFPTAAHTQIGAPSDAYLNLTVNATGGIFMEVILMNKTITRLPEAMYFGFKPTVMNGEEESIEYAMLKMGNSHVYFDEVMLNGSQYQHGVWEGIQNTITDSMNKDDGKVLSRMLIRSLDTGLVSPITSQEPIPGWFGTPTVFPCPLKPLTSDFTDILGYAFNLYNNIWMTNYVLWYPYVDTWPLIQSVDKNMKFRFELIMT